MKLNTGYRIFVMTLLSVVFIGCVTPAKKLPGFMPVARHEISGDAQLVAAALVPRLNGVESTIDAGISFGKEVPAALDAPPFGHNGFILTGQRLFQYSKRPQGKPGRLVAGQMDLRDLFGRRAKVNYIAEYNLTDAGFIIETATVQPAYTTDPQVESFLVPLKAFQKEMAKYPPTWEALYLLANRLNVLPMQNNAQNRESKDYILCAFLKDQAAPSAKAILRLANKKTSDLEYGYTKGTRYLSFNGWIVAMIGGTFPANPEKDFWVKLVFSPGKEAQSHKSIIVFQEELKTIAKK